MILQSSNVLEIVTSQKYFFSKWKNPVHKLFESLKRPFTTYQEGVHSVDAIVSTITRPSGGVESPSPDAI